MLTAAATVRHPSSPDDPGSQRHAGVPVSAATRVSTASAYPRPCHVARCGSESVFCTTWYVHASRFTRPQLVTLTI